MKMQTVLVGLSNGKFFAKKISKKTGLKMLRYDFKKFPDGENYTRFGPSVRGKKVVLAQSLAGHVNDNIMELVFAARTAKRMGAKKVVALTPYLAYMRQDTVFKSGECFSAKETGWLLSQCVDELITFEP
ncbi:MAG: ribose-phosphate pyrophosphokinase, partial [Candidatus Diapherotrites archaeon]|nr:ribose-phosphate pyrophosphokinase [Candidatus Diapherotrites archaeon]